MINEVKSIETPVRVATSPSISPAIPLVESFIRQASGLHVSARRDQVLAAMSSKVVSYHPGVNGIHVSAAADLALHSQQDFRRQLMEGGDQVAESICLAATSCVVDHAYGPEAVRALIEHVIEAIPDGQNKFLQAVNTGASKLEGDLDSGLLDFLAGLVRHVAISGDQKFRIVLPQEMRQFIRAILVERIPNNPYPPRPGGMSLVNALQARSFFPKGNVYMFCLGDMPGELIDYFPDDIKIVNEDPDRVSAAQLPRQSGWDGHFAMHSDGSGEDPNILPSSILSVKVDGVDYLREAFNKFDTILTGRKIVSDFTGLPKEWFSRLKKVDAIQLTGLHKLDCETAAATYINDLGKISSEECVVALSYSEARNKSFEMKLWEMFREARVIDLLSANVGEILQFGKRLHSLAHTTNPLNLSQSQISELDRLYELGKQKGEDGRIGVKEENPCFVAEVALFLQDILQIPLVRVRGKLIDVLVADSKLNFEDLSSVPKDLITSRYLALQKVAHPDGLLTSREHVGLALDIPSAESIAGIKYVAEDLAERAVSAEAAQMLPFDFHLKLGDGRKVFVAPTVTFSVFDGGTVSAGDLMDLFFLRGQAKKIISAAHTLNLNRRS